MTITQFEELEIWKIGLKITKDIYDITFKEEYTKDQGLRYHIRQAIVKVSSNIVEGCEKESRKEFLSHLQAAKSAVAEVRNLLYISFAVQYITENEFEHINQQLILLSSKIGALIQETKRGKKKKIVETS